MTVAEVLREKEAYENRVERNMKIQASLDYKHAQLIGAAVGAIFSKGTKFPSISKCYPDLFKEEEEERTNHSVANFLNFATAFNKSFDGNEVD